MRNVERLLLGVHADFFGKRRGYKNNIQVRGLPERQIEIGLPVGRKTRQVHAHFIGADWQRLRVECPLFVRIHVASLIRGNIANFDRCSRNRGAAAIPHRAFQRGCNSRTLSSGVGWEHHQGQCNHLQDRRNALERGTVEWIKRARDLLG